MVATVSTSASGATSERTAEAITAWLKHSFSESGASMFVLGLSGGVDSAVVCGLCARAMGPERVVGVIMPSSSDPDDAVSAEKVAKAFGVKSLTVDLTPVADMLFSSLPADEEIEAVSAELASDDTGVAPVSDNEVSVLPADAAVAPVQTEEAGQEIRRRLAKANVRPRLRMTTLYYIANLVNGIVVGTGNKSEAMIGYYTKYGDGGVDLLPIIDLYKHEVRALARQVGVPQSVIDRPPSAGLWQGQTDEDEIGLTYEALDNVLAAIESGDTSATEPTTLDRVTSMIAVSEHKRQPVPAFRRARS